MFFRGFLNAVTFRGVGARRPCRVIRPVSMVQSQHYVFGVRCCACLGYDFEFEAFISQGLGSYLHHRMN